LLLTPFIRYIGKSGLTEAKTTIYSHRLLISKLISRAPQARCFRAHKEEEDALALLAEMARPLIPDTPLIEWARALIDRGAHVNARGVNGNTPIQAWCHSKKLDSAAAGILTLLERGADLDMWHPMGWTAMALLVDYKRVRVLRELSDAGWLASANLEVPGPYGETPVQQLQRMQQAAPNDADIVEILDILAAQGTYWTQYGRPAIVAELGVHEQLVPELAELVASYVR
jgi:hypothetical protein